MSNCLPVCTSIFLSGRLLAAVLPSVASARSVSSQRRMSENSAQGRANCIFCKICDDATTEGLSKLVYNDDTFVGFRDIRPASKHHYLIVTRNHIESPKSMTEDQKPLLEQMIAIAKETLQKEGADMSDTRLGFHWPPFNTIRHIHLHAISPTAEMSWIQRLLFKENSYWFVSPDYVLSRLTSEKQ